MGISLKDLERRILDNKEWLNTDWFEGHPEFKAWMQEKQLPKLEKQLPKLRWSDYLDNVGADINVWGTKENITMSEFRLDNTGKSIIAQVAAKITADLIKDGAKIERPEESVHAWTHYIYNAAKSLHDPTDQPNF